MIDKELLDKKLLNKSNEIFTDEECEWITYYESFKSRTDSDHDKNRDPLVGALVRDADGHILEISHRASGQEGDHAEYVLLIKKLAGMDLTGCHLFTTLEPCVDDSRSAIGKSCSSIISNTEIRDIHIGILDPNPIVKERGLSTLFLHGFNIFSYSPELIDLIYDSCEAFKNPTPAEVELIKRFKKDVFKYFDYDAVKTYLTDLNKDAKDDNRILEQSIDAFILELIRKDYVTFVAKDIKVNDSIKILFYKNDYLPFHVNRTVKVIDNRNNGVDKGQITLNYPLPILFHHIEDNYQITFVDKVAFREAIANLIIHRSYNVHDALGYIEISEVEMHIKNEASKNLSDVQLRRLCDFDAESKPGDGIIADYFNKANYCERSKKGQKTFSEQREKISISVDGTNIVDVCFKYF